MSMKRTKAKSTGKEKAGETDFWAKPVAKEKTWEEATVEQADDAFSAYSMGARFALGQLITHPKFGKGVVTDVDALRVEILFEDGKKKLGHGQS